jgi:hypothetical protein
MKKQRAEYGSDTGLQFVRTRSFNGAHFDLCFLSCFYRHILVPIGVVDARSSSRH